MSEAREKLSPVTVAFHWAIGIAIICLIAVGIYMTGLEKSAWRSQVYGWHKVAGTKVLMIASLRILWRWRQGFFARASNHKPWERRLATVSHWALLIATVGMPLSGAALSYGHGHPIPILGLTQIGPPAEKIPWLGQTGSFIHYYLGYGLIGIIALHVTGALKHHLVDRDGTLRRMLGAWIA